MDAERRVLLELLLLLVAALLGRQLARLVGLLVDLEPARHLLADVLLDLGRVLHRLVAQHAHQVRDAHLQPTNQPTNQQRQSVTQKESKTWRRLERYLGLRRRFQAEADLLLLVLPVLAARGPAQLLALLLGQEDGQVGHAGGVQQRLHLNDGQRRPHRPQSTI